MLDQNTNRVWYVIGAVIVGAALVFIANGLFPGTFGSIANTFTDKTSEMTDVIHAITPGSSNGTVQLMAQELNDKSNWETNGETAIAELDIEDVAAGTYVITYGGRDQSPIASSEATTFTDGAMVEARFQGDTEAVAVEISQQTESMELEMASTSDAFDIEWIGKDVVLSIVKQDDVPVDEEVPEESEPPVDETAQLQERFDEIGQVLNNVNNWHNRNVNGGLDSYASGNKYAFLIDSITADLPVGRYTIHHPNAIAGVVRCRVMIYDASGTLLKTTTGDRSSVTFDLTDPSHSIKLRFEKVSSSNSLQKFSLAYIENDIELSVTQAP